MATFVPFAGLRFDPEKVDVSTALCPPYDVIKGAARDELIQRDAHNIVQVELAAPYGQDATPEQYQASADLLRRWQDEGVLVRDDPAFYLYEQEFTVPGTQTKKQRRGVLGALLLTEFGEGVQPHEHTLSGPKADRLNLLRATHTNTSPIFGLYSDTQGWIESLLNDVAFDAPVCQATDHEGVVHRLWKVQDDETVNAINASISGEELLIADGHHRYETALNYRNECRAQAEANGETWTGGEGENYVLMMCVSTSDDGLIVLPTHRVAKADTSSLLDDLQQYFEVTAVSEGVDELVKQIDDETFVSRPGRFGLCLNGQHYLLQLKEGTAHQSAMDAEKSAAYRDLDVSILHTLILEQLLGIDAEKLAAGGHIAYTIDAHEADEKTRAAGAAFLMRPTPVEQVQAVANAGDKMPQKSTYFYPKLITGLVLRPLH